MLCVQSVCSVCTISITIEISLNFQLTYIIGDLEECAPSWPNCSRFHAVLGKLAPPVLS